MSEATGVVRRYGQSAGSEWQRLLNQFALGEGFALIVLVVPDRDGARLCLDEVEKELAIRRLTVRLRTSWVPKVGALPPETAMSRELDPNAPERLHRNRTMRCLPTLRGASHHGMDRKLSRLTGTHSLF
jgi:hypothetical protein